MDLAQSNTEYSFWHCPIEHWISDHFCTLAMQDVRDLQILSILERCHPACCTACGAGVVIGEFGHDKDGVCDTRDRMARGRIHDHHSQEPEDTHRSEHIF